MCDITIWRDQASIWFWVGYSEYTILGHVIEASVWSLPRGHSTANFSPSTRQSIICILLGRVCSWQHSLTCNHRSTHVGLHPLCSTFCISDGLDYSQEHYIPRFQDDNRSQRPETELFLIAAAPINDTVRFHSLEDAVTDPPAQFATLQRWQLCRSILDTNQGTLKLNIIHTRRLIQSDSNAKSLSSSVKVLPIWKMWTDMDADGRRGFIGCMEKLLWSDIRTLSQWYNLS